MSRDIIRFERIKVSVRYKKSRKLLERELVGQMLREQVSDI